jgi:hypothetical protein
MGVLEQFTSAVAKATAAKRPTSERAGWIEVLIPVLLPVVIDLINKCFENKSELQAFAFGQRSALQLAGLRLRCNQTVRQAGVSGILRVQRAASDLQQTILAELDQRASTLAEGEIDVWQQAFEEAASVG